MIIRTYVMGVVSGLLMALIVHAVFATYFLDICG